MLFQEATWKCSEIQTATFSSWALLAVRRPHADSGRVTCMNAVATSTADVHGLAGDATEISPQADNERRLRPHLCARSKAWPVDSPGYLAARHGSAWRAGSVGVPSE